MSQIPGPKRLRFYERKWVVEGIAVVPPLLAALVGAVISLNDPDPLKNRLGWFLLVGALWLAGASVIKVLSAYAQDRAQQLSQDYDGLQGAVQVLHAMLTKQLDLPTNDGSLRITVHRVVLSPRAEQSPQEVEQVLAYVGGQGSGAGRRFSIRSGITGRVARDGVPYVFTRQGNDYAAFLTEMVSEWGYTRDEATKLTRDRQTAMAVPILGQPGVIGVVYLDSNRRDLFSPEVQTLVIDGCSGIAAYVDLKYGQR